ncbi:FAD-dependent oxidoreductase [Pseudothioclava arenosa]|uniref:FAD-dependent oxidoreductase n=1 Tax=Pseudothioclava arenosa TaxID=1795308 RepID=A0A2A4CI90_9RHOB|nr:FAD-dependent oxidoreductase [Pseudothioclava arenosa]PCD75783.1 FAD-dependent oxidoreductase [Pseudothioclava arenosa]
MTATPRHDVDYLVAGGGFYGCCLALFLRSLGARVLLIERSDGLLTRASQVNQARIHTGFHYPRSALTAVRSKLLSRQFARDFPDAVVDDFRMLYAVARHGSKVSASRFLRFYQEMGAPITPVRPEDARLFEDEMIEAVFECQEAAFDWSKLARHLETRLDAAGIELRFGTTVERYQDGPEGVLAQLSDGSEISARYGFNVTYAEINALLRRSGLRPAMLRHQVTELVLIRPPPGMNGAAVTVMDGPFFSSMPYPARGCYSLTHVRYTPQLSWMDADAPVSPYDALAAAAKPSKSRFMINDCARYMPCISEAEVVDSLFEVKTLLVQSEVDDGRPILFHRAGPQARVISIMGGKIDNIYDLFDLLRRELPECREAHLGWLVPGAEGAR